MPIARRKAEIDARESLRFPTRIAGDISLGGKRLPVIIDDLSERGAHVTLAAPLALSVGVRLVASGLNVQAIIVRRTARGYGLRFDAPIEPLQVVRSNMRPAST